MATINGLSVGEEPAVSISQEEVTVALNFLHVWHQKQCMCVFRWVYTVYNDLGKLYVVVGVRYLPLGQQRK